MRTGERRFQLHQEFTRTILSKDNVAADFDEFDAWPCKLPVALDQTLVTCPAPNLGFPVSGSERKRRLAAPRYPLVPAAIQFRSSTVPASIRVQPTNMKSGQRLRGEA
jgi:hypothetical protein